MFPVGVVMKTSGATTSPPPLAGEGQGGGWLQVTDSMAANPPPQAGEGAGPVRGTASFEPQG
jgi:hypothetical protein